MGSCLTRCSMTKLEVKPFQETLHESMCGPASLKIVLNYFGIEKSEAELATLMGKSDLGTSAEGFAKAAEALGLSCEVKDESEFEDVLVWLDKDVPVIVNWFTRGRKDYPDGAVADGHYSVVTGLDDEYIYLQDPEIGGMRKMSLSDFRQVWFDFSGKYIRPDGLIIRQLVAIYPKS